MKQVTKRLKTGQDLREEIEKLVKENNIKAGVLLSVVGSLGQATLRMAGAKEKRDWKEELEIVSGTGTVSVNDSHIHISVSDNKGNVFGGHLSRGCIVRTTAEVVLLAFDDVRYLRKPDEETGYDELEIGKA